MTVSHPPWWAEREAYRRTRVSRAGLARMAADLAPGGTARAGGRLQGGVESAVSAVELVDATGRRTRAVLKRRPFPHFDGRGEWEALGAAATAAVPTPDPIGFDPDGHWFGRPALVMSRLPGRARLDISGDVATMAHLAKALAAVHDRSGAGLRETTPRWARRRPHDAAGFEARMWDEIEQLAPAAGPATALVHLDFHPANTLWSRGRLSGVIDWENGARGWPAEDLTKCRTYLAISHGLVVADDLRAAYEAEIGGRIPLLALSDVAYCASLWPQVEARAYGWRQAGYPQVSTTGLESTLRQFVEAALRIG